MSDWAVGDLAVCVDDSPDDFGLIVTLNKGSIYRVRKVVVARRPNRKLNDRVGLYVAEADCGNWTGWASARFRKILPDKHESCETEFVTLLNRIKRKVSA